MKSFDRESPVDTFTRMDGPEHVRIRRNFAPQLSPARRLTELRPLIDRIVDDVVTRMPAAPQPCPLHAGFSTAVTTDVIAELIGVPAGRRHPLRDAAPALFTTTTIEELQAAPAPLWATWPGRSPPAAPGRATTCSAG